MPETNATERASRLISATRHELYAARADARALPHWLAPPGTVLAVERYDPTPGGAYRLVFTFEQGPGATDARRDIVEGRFTAMDAPKLVETEFEFVSNDPAFAGMVRMSWHFSKAEGGTLAVVIAENLPPGIAARPNGIGTIAALENLARYVET